MRIRTCRSTFSVEAASADDLEDALRATEEHGVSLRGALLWATARRTGCRTLLSEDFQDGRELGGVRFVNPFRLTKAQQRVLFL